MKTHPLSKTLVVALAVGFLVPLFAFKITVTEWLRQHIDQRFSIEFPSQPKGGRGYGTTGYHSILPEASYLATAIHYNSQPQLKPIIEPYPYYVSMLKSQLKNEVLVNTKNISSKGTQVDSKIVSSKGTLVDSASFTLDNYKGLQFSITSLHPDGKTQITRTKRVIFVEGWVYQAEYMPLAPVTKGSQEKLKKFFNSMRLTHM